MVCLIKYTGQFNVGFGFHHRMQAKGICILSRTSVEKEPIKVRQRKPYQGTYYNKLKRIDFSPL
jgi:hypothetical protein